MPFGRLLVVILAGGYVAAVGGACSLPTGDCAGVGMYGIIAEVRTSQGAPVANGATMIATDGSFADTVGPVTGFPSNQGPLEISGAENRGGNYTVRITKPFWSSVTRTVRVPGGSCGYVETQRIQATIDKLPGAPAVRGVAVDPRSVRFGFCGSGARFNTFVDADSGQPLGLVWTTSDSTVAVVAQDGLVSDRSHGVATIRATSVADPSVFGEIRVVVDPVC